MSSIPRSDSRNAVCSDTSKSSMSIKEIRDAIPWMNEMKTFKYALDNPHLGIVIICFDIECYEFEPRSMTEIGITVLDCAKLPSPITDYKKAVAETMTPFHFRMQQSGHLVNKKFCIGDPEGFVFGTTKWFSHTAAAVALTKLFVQKVDPSNPESALRPVIAMGHALQIDLGFLYRHLDLDITRCPALVGTLDTQYIAPIRGFKGPRPRIGLGDLVSDCSMGISSHELHNAGNDAAYTMLCAGIMLFEWDARNKLREQNEADAATWTAVGYVHDAYDPRYELEGRYDTNNDVLVAMAKELGKARAPPNPGALKFCLRCDGPHDIKECDKRRNHVECAKCRKHFEPRIFRTHATIRCTRRNFPEKEETAEGP